jgi:hypothetical protein
MILHTLDAVYLTEYFHLHALHIHDPLRSTQQ